MTEKIYCPECKKEVEQIVACGATSYFCNHCKKLLSSKSILTKKDIQQEKQ